MTIAVIGIFRVITVTRIGVLMYFCIGVKLRKILKSGEKEM